MESQNLPSPETAREAWEPPSLQELPVEETLGGHGSWVETFFSHPAS